jgi:hypothetical protein
MDQEPTDLTAKDIERLAAEVWDAAAKEALAKGLPVTGYYDGHLFRYHPGKGIEDFASASCSPVMAFSTGELAGPAAAVTGDASAPSRPRAADHRETANRAATDAAAAAECQGLPDYAEQTMAFARHNSAVTLEFTARLFTAFAEVVDLSAAHLARQFGTFASWRAPVAKPSPPAAPARPNGAEKGARKPRSARRGAIPRGKPRAASRQTQTS